MANLFLDLKYMIDRDGKDKTSSFFTEANHFGDTTLLKNQAWLPLGFLAEKELAELTFGTSGNAFQFQNDLFSAATGLYSEVWHRIPGENLTILGNGATVQESNSSGYCRYGDTSANSNVTYTYVADRDGFACIHLDLPKRNDFYVSVNGLELYKETISLPQMLAVGDVKSGDVLDIRIVCDAGEESSMTVSAAILNPDRFWQGYEILNASTLRQTRFDSTHVEGIIDCDRDGLLYTSIPQNGNWRVTVDGKSAEIKLVGECMVAVELSQGTHTVAITYHNSALSLGWKISLACAGVFTLLTLWVYQPRRLSRQGKYQK